jgi:hypothetical protein
LHSGIRPWKRYSIFSFAVICILCGPAECSVAPLVRPYAGSASRTEVICVISGGWHTQLGLPVGAINGPLAGLKPEFRAQATLSSAGERAITTWLEILASATFSGPSVRDLQSCSSFHSKSPPKRFSGFRTLLLSTYRQAMTRKSHQALAGDDVLRGLAKPCQRRKLEDTASDGPLSPAGEVSDVAEEMLYHKGLQPRFGPDRAAWQGPLQRCIVARGDKTPSPSQGGNHGGSFPRRFRPPPSATRRQRPAF